MRQLWRSDGLDKPGNGARAGSGHNQRSQLGASILEAILALALSSAVATSAAAGLSFQLHVFAGLSRHQRAIGISRNILEQARAFGCAAPIDCPSEFTCELGRTVFFDPAAQSVSEQDRPQLERIQVTVTDHDRQSLFKLATLVNAASPGSGC